MLRHSNDTLKRDLRQYILFEPSSLLFATLSSAGNRLLEKSIKIKSRTIVIFHVCRGRLYQTVYNESWPIFKVISAGHFHCANNGLNLSTSEIMSVLHCEAQCHRKGRMYLIMLQFH
jgi:hypothetical protein